MENLGLRASKNKEQRRIYRLKRDDVIEGPKTGIIIRFIICSLANDEGTNRLEAH
jgi:hypothetical protein